MNTQKKKIDNEYQTQNVNEVNFLKLKGVRYEFVKDIYGITSWKYTKTPALFHALKEYYSIRKVGFEDA